MLSFTLIHELFFARGALRKSTPGSASCMSNAQLTVIQSAVLNRLPILVLAPKSKVLDAPCGGTAALTLALRERGFDATGADIDPEAAIALGGNS